MSLAVFGKQEKHCATTIQLEGISIHKSKTFTMDLLKPWYYGKNVGIFILIFNYIINVDMYLMY